ncbi:alpha/beta-hydrolase [Mollisia scopiformis]|uniref:Alpha/beta-hydrolase n=1 Tax=Mollisia scopiformis TaxID=149040 RepID=A0A194XVH0_MOLSC|nr:alpha/beta-hydrolase [Mollisia scopiformis]KUJ24325.1 alpha/beta-hydrolase [Mollisia scopiformis]
MKISYLLVFTLTQVVLSNPTPTQPERLAERQLLDLPSKITDQSQIESIAAGLESDAAILGAAASILIDVLEAIVPSPVPAAIPDAISSVASVYAAHPTDFVVNALDFILDGLVPSDITNLVTTEGSEENSSSNNNPLSPSPAVYPQKSAGDAPYSLDENSLRSAIYIPSNFTYGEIPAVLLVSGTGALAGGNFGPNFGKEFQGSDYADPVYINIPGKQLADLQIEAEYVAYAVNYISAISDNKNVSVLSWSAGSSISQWAVTYWPSTRSVISDFIPISGDLHGTETAYFLCPGFPRLPCAPAILQQEYNSTFVATLRNAGGSSAYVPTTSVYSIFDEIIQPQENTGASAYVFDERKVGVSNTELQNACTVAQPGGTLYTHEGVLYNALAFALAKDALIHDGPGDLSRVDVVAECQKIVISGLSLTDVLATEAIVVELVFGALTYPDKVLSEPAIASYAQTDVPA